MWSIQEYLTWPDFGYVYGMKQKFALFIIFGFLASCSAPKKNMEPVPKEPAAEDAQGLIDTTDKMKSKKGDKTALEAKPSWTFTYERTPCFGKCPWDQLTVSSDGRIAYNGKRDVERIGTFSGRISPDQAVGLKAYLEEVGYFKMKKEYDSNISDLPALKMNFYSPSVKQEVFIRGDAPTGTTAISNKMIEIYESIQDWEEVVPNEIPHNE